MFQKTKEGGVAWIDSRKHWYITIEGQFLRKLMVCIHPSGGQQTVAEYEEREVPT
jgi:hypothetical protein